MQIMMLKLINVFMVIHFNDLDNMLRDYSVQQNHMLFTLCHL
jgi:hypothetical protein